MILSFTFCSKDIFILKNLLKHLLIVLRPNIVCMVLT